LAIRDGNNEGIDSEDSLTSSILLALSYGDGGYSLTIQTVSEAEFQSSIYEVGTFKVPSLISDASTLSTNGVLLTSF
jgi:hypothetical protein